MARPRRLGPRALAGPPRREGRRRAPGQEPRDEGFGRILGLGRGRAGGLPGRQALGPALGPDRAAGGRRAAPALAEDARRPSRTGQAAVGGDGAHPLRADHRPGLRRREPARGRQGTHRRPRGGRLVRTALLLALALPASAAVAPARLTEANALYESSRYTEAAASYETLLKESPYDAALQYNLGNARFRQGGPGSLGRATAAYLRAFRLDPRDGDVRANLDFSLKRAGETLVPAGMPPAVFVLYNVLSATELAALHWLAFWAACLLGAGAFLVARARAPLKAAALTAAFAWGAAGGWWALRVSTGFKDPAVVVLQDAEVRSGPGEGFPVSFKVPEGR
ncbi:tetratricopeptide repeat protein, partial [bacterium]